MPPNKLVRKESLTQESSVEKRKQAELNVAVPYLHLVIHTAQKSHLPSFLFPLRKQMNKANEKENKQCQEQEVLPPFEDSGFGCPPAIDTREITGNSLEGDVTKGVSHVCILGIMSAGRTRIFVSQAAAATFSRAALPIALCLPGNKRALLPKSL